MMKTNGVIWITGFSAAGKTSLARKVETLLRKKEISTVSLDGDDLRNILGDHWGYDKTSRQDLAKIYMRLCSHLSSQGHVVIISAVAMFTEVEEWMRSNIPNAIQVYLDVPRKEREERDSRTKKILSSKSYDDTIYDIPQSPDLLIHNFGAVTIDESAESIVNTFFNQVGSTQDLGRDQHWNTYYKHSKVPVTPSPYALSVMPQLQCGSTLLEIGSGNGRDTAFFASQGVKVTAIDRSEAAIELCKETHQEFPISFLAGVLSDLWYQFGGKKFDAIYCRFVLHAMPLSEEIATLHHCSQLMKPGAHLYIECRSINDPLARKGEILSKTERIDGHYRRFIVLDELKERLSQASFKVVHAVESDGLSAHGNDNPVVIRLTAERVVGFEYLVSTPYVLEQDNLTFTS